MLPTEIEYIRAAQNGDQRAFSWLVGQHADQVRRTVVSMLGEGPQAEDVAQEVFIRLHRSLKDFKADARMSTYLYRIAINLSLDAIKKRKRRRVWQLPGGKDQDQAMQQITDDNAGVERQDLQDSIRYALQKLEPDFRAVVTLRLIQGYNVQETADMLGIPQGTVASRLARAQKQLRALLKDDLERK